LTYIQIQNIINYVNEQTSTSSIPLSHISNSEDIISEDDKSLLKTEVGIPIESHVSDSSKEINVSPENQMSVSTSPPYENKSRPPISILHEDPKEKQKFLIKMNHEYSFAYSDIGFLLSVQLSALYLVEVKYDMPNQKYAELP
ncbi:1307_t:CDS:2, partial [Acaulospora morrowiae]